MISHWTVAALLVVVFINTVFIGALAYFLYVISRRVEEGIERATPVLQQARETLGRLDESTAQLQQRVDHFLDRTTKLVEKVSDRVDTTTAIAQEAVTEPLIDAVSLMAGIQRGLRVYSERAGGKGDGR